MHRTDEKTSLQTLHKLPAGLLHSGVGDAHSSPDRGKERGTLNQALITFSACAIVQFSTCSFFPRVQRKRKVSVLGLCVRRFLGNNSMSGEWEANIRD